MSLKNFYLSLLTCLFLGVPGLSVMAQAPVNDDCSNAIPLSCGDTITASTYNATVDVNAPTCPLRVGPAVNITSPGLWYTFVGNDDFIQINTCPGFNQLRYKTVCL